MLLSTLRAFLLHERRPQRRCLPGPSGNGPRPAPRDGPRARVTGGKGRVGVPAPVPAAAQARPASDPGGTGPPFMQANELFFVIPTYRLRDVGETVEQYDEHFWRNGHSVRMIVFDDSSPATQEKYFPLLEQTSTHNDLYYVGPREKEQFLGYLRQRLRDKRLDGLIKNLFRPSYGGNRNFTLMYTLGGLMVSSD